MSDTDVEVIEDEPVELDHNEECETPDLIPGYKNIQDYITEGYKVLTNGVKASCQLPMGKNFLFYQTYPSFKDEMLKCGSNIQGLLENLLELENIRRNVRNCTIEDAMDAMQDINDVTLDRSRQTMDFMDGIKGNALLAREVASTVVSGAWNKTTAPKGSDALAVPARGPPRPQFSFADEPNNSNMPWEPKITYKPNALQSLAILPLLSDGVVSWSHPYEFELESYEVPESLLEKVIPKKPKALEDTPLIMVDTEESLQSMVADLSQQSVIGIDLEHHSMRSYLGFTCLLQISTYDQDYIVDTLKLRANLHVLNEVFTNPSIIKVFHGADSDIGWLQRDFGVYVVGMFDTYQAAKILSYPRFSLAYLLHCICGVSTDKRYQLYDWRTRPLPEGAIHYARQDTHYLMYIYQCLSNQLIDKALGETNLLKACFSRSTDVCKIRYSKPEISEDSYMMLYRKGKRHFNTRQLYALKGLYLWRDKVAREQDESVEYVMPNHMMLQIAETLPREAQGILACCHPVPPLVRANLLELHYIIVSAQGQPLNKIVPETNPVPVETLSVAVGVTEERRALDEWAYPPIEKAALPTLLDAPATPPMSPNCESPPPNFSIIFMEEPQLSLKDDVSEISQTNEIDEEIRKRLSGVQFVSPFQRYMKVLPYALQLEKEQQERDAAEAKRIEAEVLLKQQQGNLMNSLTNDGVVKLKREMAPAAPLKDVVAEENRFKRQRFSAPQNVEATPEEDAPQGNEYESPVTYIPPKKRGTKRKSVETSENDEPCVPRPTKIKKEEQHVEDDIDSSQLQSSVCESIKEEPLSPSALKEEEESHPAENSNVLSGDDLPKEDVKMFLPVQETSFESKVKGAKGSFKKNGKKQGKPNSVKGQKKGFKPFDYSKVDFTKFSSEKCRKTAQENTKANQDKKTPNKFMAKGKRKTDILGNLKKIGGDSKKKRRR